MAYYRFLRQLRWCSSRLLAESEPPSGRARVTASGYPECEWDNESEAWVDEEFELLNLRRSQAGPAGEGPHVGPRLAGPHPCTFPMGLHHIRPFGYTRKWLERLAGPNSLQHGQ